MTPLLRAWRIATTRQSEEAPDIAAQFLEAISLLGAQALLLRCEGAALFELASDHAFAFGALGFALLFGFALVAGAHFLVLAG